MAYQAETISWRFHLAHDSRQKEVIAANLTVLILAAGTVVLRFVSRKINGAKISYDDVTVLFALGFSASIVALELYGVRYLGFGKHAILAGLVNLRKLLKDMFVFEIMYNTAIGVSKLAILLLYNRIFSHTRPVRFCIYSVIALVLACKVVGLTLILVQCRPIHHFWDRVNPLAPGICYDFTAAFRTLSTVNIVSDIMILLLPILVVRKLQVTPREKVLISLLFLLGGFVTVASGFRLHYIPDLNAPTDPTWDLVSIGIWSSVECCMAVVCANLAIMRPVFIRYIQAPLSKLRSFSRSRSSLVSSETPKESHPKPQQRIVRPNDYISEDLTQMYTKDTDSTVSRTEINADVSTKDSGDLVTEPAIPAPRRSNHWRSFIPHIDSRLQFTTMAGSATNSHVDPKVITTGTNNFAGTGIHVQNDLNWSTEEKCTADIEAKAGKD